jgi:hypothetical protein
MRQIRERGNPDDRKAGGRTLLYHGPISDKERGTRTWEYCLWIFWKQKMIVETIPFVSATSATRVDLANYTSTQGQSIVSRSWHLNRRPGRCCLDVQRAHRPEQHGRAFCVFDCKSPTYLVPSVAGTLSRSDKP